MSAPQRMRAWGAGVAAGYVAIGVVATVVVHVPGAPLFFGLCAVVSLVLAHVIAPLLRPRDQGGGDGGGGPAPPPEPEPPWWPQFERDLQDYVQRLTSGRP
jgi:hypothetical protein